MSVDVLSESAQGIARSLDTLSYDAMDNKPVSGVTLFDLDLRIKQLALDINFARTTNSIDADQALILSDQFDNLSKRLGKVRERIIQ